MCCSFLLYFVCLECSSNTVVWTETHIVKIYSRNPNTTSRTSPVNIQTLQSSEPAANVRCCLNNHITHQYQETGLTSEALQSDLQNASVVRRGCVSVRPPFIASVLEAARFMLHQRMWIFKITFLHLNFWLNNFMDSQIKMLQM